MSDTSELIRELQVIADLLVYRPNAASIERGIALIRLLEKERSTHVAEIDRLRAEVRRLIQAGQMVSE